MKYILISSIIFGFFSCKEIESRTSQKILKVPKNLISYDSKNSVNMEKLQSNSLIIYTSINTSCANCLLSFKNWGEFEGLMKNNNILFIPICHSKDDFDLLKYLLESGELESLHFPMYLDKKNEFLHSNKSLINKKNSITVLTNANNEILLSGNPFDSKALMEKYLKIIRKSK